MARPRWVARDLPARGCCARRPRAHPAFRGHLRL